MKNKKNIYCFIPTQQILSYIFFVIFECMVGFQNTLLEFLNITLIGLNGLYVLYLLVEVTKRLHQEDLKAPPIDYNPPSFTTSQFHGRMNHVQE